MSTGFRHDFETCSRRLSHQKKNNFCGRRPPAGRPGGPGTALRLGPPGRPAGGRRSQKLFFFWWLRRLELVSKSCRNRAEILSNSCQTRLELLSNSSRTHLELVSDSCRTHLELVSNSSRTCRTWPHTVRFSCKLLRDAVKFGL